MNNLPTKTEKSPSEYDNIPVFYCKTCLSLKVIRVAGMDDAAFCDDCSSTDIGECSIEEWRAMYKERYGFDYLNNTL